MLYEIVTVSIYECYTNFGIGVNVHFRHSPITKYALRVANNFRSEVPRRVAHCFLIIIALHCYTITRCMPFGEMRNCNKRKMNK